MTLSHDWRMVLNTIRYVIRDQLVGVVVTTSDVNRFFFALFFFENELVFENKFESDSKLNMSIGRHDVCCQVL